MLKTLANKFSLETLIFQEGSEVLTYRPEALDVEVIGGGNDSPNERTPRQRQQNFKQGNADTNEGPYETPVVLRTKPWASSQDYQDDDTEAEDSEIERIVVAKRKKATRVSSRQLELVD